MLMASASTQQGLTYRLAIFALAMTGITGGITWILTEMPFQGEAYRPVYVILFNIVPVGTLLLALAANALFVNPTAQTIIGKIAAIATAGAIFGNYFIFVNESSLFDSSPFTANNLIVSAGAFFPSALILIVFVSYLRAVPQLGESLPEREQEGESVGEATMERYSF